MLQLDGLTSRISLSPKGQSTSHELQILQCDVRSFSLGSFTRLKGRAMQVLVRITASY